MEGIESRQSTTFGNNAQANNLSKYKKNDKTFGLIPPKDIELEMSVLGALMLERDSLTNVIDILKVDSFYRESHQEIYKAIVELFNKSEPIDILTVVNQLRKNGSLESVGGAHYIAYLTNNIGSSANIEAHARLIVEKFIKRKLISFADIVQKRAYDDSIDVFNLLDQSEQSLFEVGENLIKKSYSDIRSLVKESFKDLEAKKNHKEGIIGVPSGFIDLDRLTQGWQKSDLVIIAARPGMGKTAFMLNSIRNASVDHGFPVALFSLEMSGVQLINRLISSESELEAEKLKKGSLEPHEWQQLIHKTEKLSDAKIYIDDTPALSIFELRAKCRRLKAKHNIQLVVVDYLQLMSGDSNSKNSSGNREQEIAAISRALKSLAKELDVCVIAASQLSRAVETRGGDKKPQLSDLRESGSIEQDADMVIFLYRPDYYGLDEGTDGMPIVPGYTELIVAKHRNGSLKNVAIKYINRYTKFTDLDSGKNSSEFKASKINDFKKSTDLPF